MCMPARGDRIKVRFDEIDNTLRAYIIFQQHPKTLKNCFFTQLATYSKKIKIPNLIKSINLIKSNINQLNLIHFNTKSIDFDLKLRKFN